MNAKKRKKQIYSRLQPFLGRVLVKSYDGKWGSFRYPAKQVDVYWPISKP